MNPLLASLIEAMTQATVPVLEQLLIQVIQQHTVMTQPQAAKPVVAGQS